MKRGRTEDGAGGTQGVGACMCAVAARTLVLAARVHPVAAQMHAAVARTQMLAAQIPENKKYGYKNRETFGLRWYLVEESGSLVGRKKNKRGL